VELSVIDMITLGSWVNLAATGLTFFTAAAAVWTSHKNTEKIQEVHLSLNSRLTQLLIATRDSAHAAGKVEGQAKQKND
jgi:hypothetical protein